MADVKQSLFVRELNDALGQSRLSSEEIVRKLQSLGYLVGVTNLDSWCRGESLPRNALAFQLAGSMEDILDVQRGRLCESLLYDLFPVKTLFSDEHITPELVTLVSESDVDDFEDSYSLTEDTDWAIDSHRLVVKDEIRVSSDCKTVLWNTIIGSLVPPVSNPSVEIGMKLGKNEVPYQGTFIFGVHGAYIGKESSVEQDGERSYSATLVLSDPDIVPGDIAFCSYVRGSTCQEEQARLAWRIFRRELDFYSCTIFFEGQAPQSAEYVMMPRHNDGKSEPVVVESLEVRDNFIKMAIRDFGQAGESGYIRYRL